MERQVDIAIIGCGSAGMRAYKQARKHTDSIAVIEADQYGTTCARVGCMPSKLMIAPAEARHRLAVFEQFGLSAPSIEVDGPAVMKRVREERDRFVGFVREEAMGFDEKHRIMARATFVDDHTLSLSNGDTVTAQRIVICAGSRPAVPDLYKAAGDRLVTSNDIFYWQDLPESVAVMGTGVIALELGQALHRLGVRVRVLGRSQSIGFLTDPALLAYAAKTFQAELPLSQNTTVTDLAQDDNGVTLNWLDADGQRQQETFALLLCAVGRQSNADTLGLANTSLALDKNRVPVHDPTTMQCRFGNGEGAHVFIAGDASDDRQLLHEAADEGNIAGANAATYPRLNSFERKPLLAVMFTDPQIAVVGQSYRELHGKHTTFVTGAGDFEDQGRSRVMLVNKGLMHVYADPGSQRLLGAEMIGPSHEHLAHLLAWAIQMKLTVQEALDMPYYHPVVEEGLRDALYDLRYNLNRYNAGQQQPAGVGG
ncbi:MAG: dihydrolipoyl dehydrogenase [Cyanobacteria bacterium HKST-UBA04]|nr:dihydrolipoyl dehydrogenase [Cyanobacteria bacterium HKST-UBA04]